MTEGTAAQAWHHSRTLVIVWLLVFFPVGLFGMWKGQQFDKTWRLGITAAVVVLFVVLGTNFMHPVYVFLFFPVALYLLWKSTDHGRALTVRFGIGWAVAIVLCLVGMASRSGGGYDGYVGGSCAAVMTQGSCTYYRDSDCNVIAKECN